MKVQANPAQAHLVPGYRLDDRYELLYPFAQGGMATVWLARVQGKHGFEKLVAVKTILPHLASDEGFRRMFLDEASIASRIRHPNVADIVDLGEESSTLYMVLEWVNGDSWAKLHTAVSKAGHAFPLNLLLRIAADACAGLHAAHELSDDSGARLSVVHRDVSPQNILITVAGVTKVIDFGIAKAFDRLAEQTQTGMLKGKAQYAAPEQVKGAGKAYDRRADLWAIGTILYHYLSGKLPYEGKNDLATLKNLNAGKPPPPLPPTVPPQVVNVVMTALSHSPAGRFATALDMERALESVMPQPTTSADVAAFMAQYLSDRMEMRRRDLADALNEAMQRSGTPQRARGRLGSFPELARPAILDQALGRQSSQIMAAPAMPGSQMPQASPLPQGSQIMTAPAMPGSQMPQASPLAQGSQIMAAPVMSGSQMPQPSPFGQGPPLPQASPYGQGSQMPQASLLPQASPYGQGSQMPQASPLAGRAPQVPEIATDNIPTRLQSGRSALRAGHWALPIVGTAVPLGVWSTVGYLAATGAHPGGQHPAPAVSASTPAEAASAGAPR